MQRVAHKYKIVPLHSFLGKDDTKVSVQMDPTQKTGRINDMLCSKETIIRKTTIAYGYGIVQLLQRSKTKLRDDEIQIDNFVVSVLKKPSRSWDDIVGVGMISSGLSLTLMLMIEEPSYLSVV